MPRHTTAAGAALLLTVLLTTSCSSGSTPDSSAAPGGSSPCTSATDAQIRDDLNGIGSSRQDGSSTMDVEFSIENHTTAPCDYTFTFTYTGEDGKQHTIDSTKSPEGKDAWKNLAPGEQRAVEYTGLAAKNEKEDWEDQAGKASTAHLKTFTRKPHTG
ncbi:hypothetical protein ACIGZJ_17055 [Kitasatospora sp. NPDC052868]|uniref:hypothetical protein n=1 Tax=Kitasatospora sp. NPDC052868 TaxID=3364060 RepID=UPI0037C90ECD